MIARSALWPIWVTGSSSPFLPASSVAPNPTRTIRAAARAARRAASFSRAGIDRTLKTLAIPTLLFVKPVLLVAAGALVTTLAFPPFGPGVLVVAGVVLFLLGLRR